MDVASTTQDTIPEHHGLARRLASPLWGAAFALVSILMGAIVGTPLQSLESAADGASLAGDGRTALVFGALCALGAAAIVYLGRAQLQPRVGSLVGGAAFAGVLAWGSFANMANELARAPVYGIGIGSFGETAQPTGWGILFVTFAIAGLGVFGGVRAWSARRSLARLGVVLLAGVGTAGILFGAWSIQHASSLAAQARARPHYSTPGFEVVILVAAAAALALALRKRA